MYQKVILKKGMNDNSFSAGGNSALLNFLCMHTLTPICFIISTVFMLIECKPK